MLVEIIFRATLIPQFCQASALVTVRTDKGFHTDTWVKVSLRDFRRHIQFIPPHILVLFMRFFLWTIGDLVLGLQSKRESSHIPLHAQIAPLAVVQIDVILLIRRTDEVVVRANTQKTLDHII